MGDRKGNLRRKRGKCKGRKKSRILISRYIVRERDREQEQWLWEKELEREKRYIRLGKRSPPKSGIQIKISFESQR